MNDTQFDKQKQTPEFEVAVQAAQLAGTILREAFGKAVEIRSKAPAELVTDADVASEKCIIQTIRNAFPNHQVLAEESGAGVGSSGNSSGEHLWVIDPLDGTNNFAHQLSHFSISIAYLHNGLAQCGVIFNPVRGDWYVTSRGQGAWQTANLFNQNQIVVNAESEACAGVLDYAKLRKCQVSSAPLSESLVGVGFYYDRGKMMEATLVAIGDLFRSGIHGIRRMGTASLDLANVGCGTFGAFFEYQLKPWDFAAGQLFVEEAGGRVTNCVGDDIREMKSTSILAASPSTFEKVLHTTTAHFDKF